jgi:hypothetical protein
MTWRNALLICQFEGHGIEKAMIVDWFIWDAAIRQISTTHKKQPTRSGFQRIDLSRKFSCAYTRTEYLPNTTQHCASKLMEYNNHTIFYPWFAASIWEITPLPSKPGVGTPCSLVSQIVEVNSTGWGRWKKSHYSKFHKTIPYILLFRIAGWLLFKFFSNTTSCISFVSSTFLTENFHFKDVNCLLVL